MTPIVIKMLPELLTRIEDFRASQRPVLSRSEAVRRLLELALDKPPANRKRIAADASKRDAGHV